MDAFQRLLAYPWPGNIRELRNVIRTALAICDGGVVRLIDLPREIRDHAAERQRARAGRQPPESDEREKCCAPYVRATETCRARPSSSASAATLCIAIASVSAFRHSAPATEP